MKRKLLSVLMVFCLILSLAPAALAVDGAVTTKDELVAALAGSQATIILGSDIDLGTDTLTINRAVTIDGTATGKYEIKYSGTGNALNITATNGKVTLKDLKVTADATGNVNGPFAVSITSSQPDVKVENCVIKAYTRGINMYPAGGCTDGKLVVTGTDILNSRITDYANSTTVGDTRGIALYDVKSSTIEISNNSAIKGFGYSINMSGTPDANGARSTNSTFDISNSKIWGWSALNIWTVGNTYNLVNCDMRGLNPLDTVGNSFSVIVLNPGIYGSAPSQVTPNVFNITGGVYTAVCTSGSENVEETLFSIDDDYCSKFNFYMYENEETMESEYVTLICDRAFSAFMACYSGMTDAGMRNWASSHVTGNLNTVYNWGLLAPGMESSPWPVSTLSEGNMIQTMPQSFYMGGEIE